MNPKRENSRNSSSNTTSLSSSPTPDVANPKSSEVKVPELASKVLQMNDLLVLTALRLDFVISAGNYSAFSTVRFTSQRRVSSFYDDPDNVLS